MRAAVLTYHSQNITGNDYTSNDHVALASDLAQLRALGIQLIPLSTLVAALLGSAVNRFPAGCVALTCDDGTLLDWEDYEHPLHGHQASFDRLLREHLAQTGESAHGQITSFLIASPDARKSIDAGCYGGIPLSDESWWLPAARSGRFAFGNHSWDHAHVCLRDDQISATSRGHFMDVIDDAEADRQIMQASQYLNRALAPANHRVRWFAYPYGHCTDFLASHYLPSRPERHLMEAAFTTEAAFVTMDTPRYRIPRFVCGSAWRTPDDFNHLARQLITI